MALAVPDSQAVRAAQTGRTGHAADRCHPHHPALFPVPGGNGDGQALPRSVERIDEARRAAEAQSAVCDAIRAEIMDVFRQLDDEVDFMILFRRYILLENWDKIAVHVRLAKRWTFTRHRAAIEKLEIKDSTEQHQTASIQHPESEV